MNQLSYIYTPAEADSIIMILAVIVIVLLVLGGIGLRQSRIIRQRNEQLRRILNALDDYRAIVGDGELSLDEQEEMVKKKLEPETKTTKAAQKEEGAFFVKMDARVNKEKPFTDPERTKDYINSLRAEYAAKLLMDYSGSSMEDIVAMCGFKDAAAFNKAFKFSIGITPTEYLHTISQIFKNKV